ncbi:hypothetical protein OC846_005360 [Tilletia horrida]|uniref:Uncharacterized protein n=1 Tax=Tilletia horrida TaxID=155126 RepID=A0AAN6JPZ8_9BASI|nr:hypothetical protein OC846_005360 [Tilletia horrida]
MQLTGILTQRGTPPPTRILSKGSTFPAKIPVKQLKTPVNSAIWVVQVEGGGSKLNLALDAQFTDLVINPGVYKPSATTKKEADFKVMRISEEVAFEKQNGDHIVIAGQSLNKFNFAVADKKWYESADDKDGFLLGKVDCKSPTPIYIEFGKIKVSIAGISDKRAPDGQRTARGRRALWDMWLGHECLSKTMTPGPISNKTSFSVPSPCFLHT